MDLRTVMRERLSPHLPLLAAACALSLTTYVGLQQAVRMGANEPQIAMAEDAAAALAQGQALAQVVPPVRAVPAARSAAPFVVVYGEDRQPRAATGTIDGATPVLPGGVFDAAKARGEHRVTWAPRPELRFAAVVVHYAAADGSGYVLAARSLRETEARIKDLGRIVALGWLATVVAAAAAAMFVRRKA